MGTWHVLWHLCEKNFNIAKNIPNLTCQTDCYFERPFHFREVAALRNKPTWVRLYNTHANTSYREAGFFAINVCTCLWHAAARDVILIFWVKRNFLLLEGCLEYEYCRAIILSRHGQEVNGFFSHRYSRAYLVIAALVVKALAVG